MAAGLKNSARKAEALRRKATEAAASAEKESIAEELDARATQPSNGSPARAKAPPVRRKGRLS